MYTLTLAKPDRALLSSRVADCYHQVEVNALEFVSWLGAPFVVDADLLKRHQCLGMNVSRRFSSRRSWLPTFPQPGTRDGLGHLRAAELPVHKNNTFLFVMNILFGIVPG